METTSEQTTTLLKQDGRNAEGRTSAYPMAMTISHIQEVLTTFNNSRKDVQIKEDSGPLDQKGEQERHKMGRKGEEGRVRGED